MTSEPQSQPPPPGDPADRDSNATRKDQQLASQLRHAIQTIIDRGLHDPRISGMITVTGVRVIDNGRGAHVHVSVLPAEKQRLTLQGLSSATGHIRQAIGSAIHGRTLPRLEFRLDESAKKQAGVLGAIAQIEQERERGGDRPGFHAGVQQPSPPPPPAAPPNRKGNGP